MRSPIITTHPLGEAVTLYHVATDRFKTARLTFLTVRRADETESPLATLHYGIMRRGSEAYPRLASLNRRLDELYGTTLTIRNYIHGDDHIISFTAEMLADEYRLPNDRDTDILGGVTELLADMILHTLRDRDRLLRAEATEAEKRSLADSLRGMINDPRTYAADKFRRVMCPHEPYGISIGGTPEKVAEITVADVSAHRDRELAATRCAIFYTGRASASTVTSLWDKHFGAWHPSSTPHIATRPHPIPDAPQYVEEERPVSQGKLCMGWSCGENEHTLDAAVLAAMQVCNELFGVMPTSLLFRRVREALGLCYYCESALDMTKGILWVSSGIRSDRREAAERAIRDAFASLVSGEITPADLESAKLSLIESYRQIEDSQGATEAYLVRRMLGGGEQTPAERIAAITAVTLSDIVDAARRFRPDTVYFLRGTAAEEDNNGSE